MSSAFAFEKTSLEVTKDAWVSFCVNAGQPAEAAEASWAKTSKCEFFKNETYLVQIDKMPTHQFKDAEIWLLWISRHDKDFVRDRQDLMAIKNALVGDDVEAVELFPAESRVSDATNRTALYCFMKLNETINPKFPAGPNRASVGYLGQH